MQDPREKAGLRGLDVWMGGLGQEVRPLQIHQDSRLGGGEVYGLCAGPQPFLTAQTPRAASLR